MSASFNYRLEPAVSVQGCPAYCSVTSRICLAIYYSQPASTLELDTWYQTRNIVSLILMCVQDSCIRGMAILGGGGRLK